MPAGNRQLLVFAFPAGSEFEGRLVGAIERIESGGAMRILAAMFVGRQADSGELVAASLSTESSAGLIGKLLAFRLEDQARARATERVLESPAGEAVRAMAQTLRPGEAVAGIVVEHTWALGLAETIERIGGRQVVSEVVGEDQSHDLAATLLAVATERATEQR